MEIKTIVIAIVMGIIGLVVAMTIFGNMAPELTASAISAQYPNNCSDGTDPTGAKLTLNSTSLYCMNSTGNAQYLAKLSQMPLSSLFSPTGVLMLLLVVAIFIVLLIFALRMIKK